MPEFHHAGTAIHYENAGRGPVLVLLHGLGSSGADWAFQVPAFAPHFTVLMPDLRGSGRSAKPRGRYSIAGFATDTLALIDSLGHRRVHLLGFSLGGSVALEMALLRPDLVERLVLINSLPDYRIDTRRKWMEARMQSGMVRVLGPAFTARLVARRLFPHPHQIPMRRRVVETVGTNSRRAYLATIRALIGWSALDRLDRLRAETLVLAAEHDYTPLAEKRAYAERMGATFAMIRGSRHGTPFDSIQATNACALAFLHGEALPHADSLVIDAADAAPTAAPTPNDER
jgi:3-oxoadipate enol-lactonase